MTERTKSTILFWVLFGLLMLGARFLIKATGPTQDDAARRNMEALKASRRSPLALPEVVPPPPKYYTNMLQWDYAPTNWITVSNFRVYRAYGHTSLWTTNWAAGRTLSNRIVTVHASNYTFAVTAVGTNGLESDFSNLAFLPVPLKTNLVVTITGTNMSCSTNGIKGPWRNVAGNLVVVTNFGGKSQLWRGSSVHETHTWK